MTTTTSTRPARRSSAPDAVSARAVDQARAAAVEAADLGTVGEHLGVRAVEDRVVAHTFASTAKGYRGWVWTVLLARAPRSRTATVSEVALLPAEDAVLAPQWLPWSERLAPGDLRPGDVLPRREDDDRLDQGYEATDDEESDRVALVELGLGRARVLSAIGRSEAATRWYEGDRGPIAPEAGPVGTGCSTCGFLLRLDGGLRTVFGVCANEWSPSDGRVVSMDHGCGAHSETDVEHVEEERPTPVLDEFAVEEL